MLPASVAAGAVAVSPLSGAGVAVAARGLHTTVLGDEECGAAGASASARPHDGWLSRGSSGGDGASARGILLGKAGMGHTAYLAPASGRSGAAGSARVAGPSLELLQPPTDATAAAASPSGTTLTAAGSGRAVGTVETVDDATSLDTSTLGPVTEEEMVRCIVSEEPAWQQASMPVAAYSTVPVKLRLPIFSWLSTGHPLQLRAEAGGAAFRFFTLSEEETGVVESMLERLTAALVHAEGAQVAPPAGHRGLTFSLRYPLSADTRRQGNLRAAALLQAAATLSFRGYVEAAASCSRLLHPHLTLGGHPGATGFAMGGPAAFHGGGGGSGGEGRSTWDMDGDGATGFPPTGSSSSSSSHGASSAGAGHQPGGVKGYAGHGGGGNVLVAAGGARKMIKGMWAAPMSRGAGVVTGASCRIIAMAMAEAQACADASEMRDIMAEAAFDWAHDDWGVCGELPSAAAMWPLACTAVGLPTATAVTTSFTLTRATVVQ